ncbi:MAG: hydantoinase/oxoprolinase family protein [Chloroflexota bacterium]
MEFNMDIDTGGTFTDGFVRGDGRIELVKVGTTPHDFSLCFMECVEEAARRFGYQQASQLLAQMKVLRLSTTIGTNALIQSSGPKLGLLVTRGLGENAYAQAGTPNPAIDFIIPKDMIIGIDEEVSEDGASISAPLVSQVLSGVKTLLEKGARRIVVSLARSPLNPANEKRCREIVLTDYPAHYLGTVPLLISTEISSELDDQYRTNAALIDAYMHQEMAHYLYKADEDARNGRFKYPLLIVHATGGVARVAKTKAIDTCDSGPAAGLLGASFLARLYGLENVATVDVGGTSTDIGLVAHGEPSFSELRELSGVPIKERFIESISIGGGGSSIARLQGKSKQLKVGPESAGGIPGPACYSLGGTNATVTDSWVTLGYIDPAYFLGGRRKLDSNLARAAIKKIVADPLNMTLEQAADAIVKEVNSQCGQSVKEFISTKGVEAKDVTMFAFGGAGGLACSSIAKAAGVHKIYFFPFGAAFCAFGSSCTDVLHNYSVVKSLPLEPDSNSTTIQEFNRIVQEMTDDAHFDMEGEGFEKGKVLLALEIVMVSENSPSRTAIRWSPLLLKSETDVAALLNLYREKVTPGTADDKVFVKEFRLKASCHLPDPQFPSYTPAGKNPQAALKGKRAAYYDGKFQDAQVYEQSLLKCGNIVKGLAFIESPSTTILVPPRSQYQVDQYLNGIMEEA